MAGADTAGARDAAGRPPDPGDDLRIVRGPGRAGPRRASTASTECRVNLATETATVLYDEHTTGPEAFRSKVARPRLLGAGAAPTATPARPRARPQRLRHEHRRPAPDRGRGAHGPADPHLDGARAHDHGLAVDRVGARDAGDLLGRLAVPPGDAREPPPRRSHDGHARVARHHGGLALVGRGAGVPRRNLRRHADDDRRRWERSARLLRDRRRDHHVAPARQVLRSAVAPPFGRRAARAARARA